MESDRTINVSRHCIAKEATFPITDWTNGAMVTKQEKN